MTVWKVAAYSALLLVWSGMGWAQAGTPAAAPGPATASSLTVTVVDDNGVAVPGARVFLESPAGGPAASPGARPEILRRETDFAGRCVFSGLTAPAYQIRVEREGFYASPATTVQAGSVEVSLLPQREVKEEVTVTESPPSIDPAQTVSAGQLSGLDIVNIPYPVTRDFRNALNFIPEVVQNPADNLLHVAGAETYQTVTILDGFNVTQPANGQLRMRISTDAFRSVNVATSRYPAEFGKGSGGVVQLNTRVGDDHYRFSATDFIPSIQNKGGLAFDQVTPRITVSGPIARGKAWFFDALDGEYDNTLFAESVTQSPGYFKDVSWRVGNLAKVQTNLTARNILTTNFNYNRSYDQHYGFSNQNPPAATPILNEPIYEAAGKDQHYFAGGELLEVGLGFNRYDLNEYPRGSAPYFITPDVAGGSYYFMAHTRADRWQGFSNLFLRPMQWHGRHEIKVGTDLDRLGYWASFLRTPVSFVAAAAPGQPQFSQACPVDANGVPTVPSPCSRYSTFAAGLPHQVRNVEISGYVQDRWSLTNRFLVEAGLRYDWDEILRDSLISPRLAMTYVLDNSGDTKLSAGAGLFYDATPLFLIARPFAGDRTDYFFDNNGLLVSGPVMATFNANPGKLHLPRVVNWSVAVERKLPAQVYLKVEFTQKRGTNGLVYNTLPGALSTTSFFLQNTREDHYDAVQITARHPFKGGHSVFASYAHSKTISNQVLDFNVDNPVFSSPTSQGLQLPGPYPWDAPDRILSWGLLPLIRGFDFAYSGEMRSGFPFFTVDQQQRIVNPPGSYRFPRYFNLNTHIEKRFHFLGYYWAVRGGFDNVTGRKNYTFVNNNVQAGSQFLTYGGYEGRAFTGRIRFLGKK